MDDDLSFGRRVKVRRVALGLTQAELAERTGYSTVTIRKIESDNLRPSRQIADKLAEVLVLPSEERSDFVLRARGDVGAEHGRQARSKITHHPSILPQTVSLPPFLEEQAVAVTPPPVFVGRDRELTELAAALQTARSGKGQILFVIGGAGRGKTMLVQEFARQAQAADAELLVVSGYGNVHTGIGDPYFPFREALTMLTGEVEAKWAGGLITADHARRLWEAMTLTIAALVEHAPDLVGSFVPNKGLRERAATFTPADAFWFKQLATLTNANANTKLEQQHVFVQYMAALAAIAHHRPLMLILEDLHWVDPASSSLLFYLSREISQCRILIVGTYRPDELALSRGEIQHPLAGILSELKRWHGDIWLDLGQLAPIEGRRFVDAYLDTQPNRLGPEFREALFRRTGGHALFTVELLREMQERGDLRKDADIQWIEGPAVDWNKLPTKVEGVIEKRIQRLEKDLQSILSIASIEGEAFTAEVVARVQQLNERGLVQQLSGELDRRHRLVTAQMLSWLGQQRLSLYRFRHQLFQHYLYFNLAEMERTYLHEAVGTVLESIYAEQTEQVAVQLAHHFEQAGLTLKAINYLLQAGKRAGRMSANQEAIAHLTKGLALLETLSESPERDQQELELQIALGNALIATKGYAAPEAEQTYKQARELYQRVETGESSKLFPLLYGRWAYYLVKGEHQTAHQLAEEFYYLAQRQQDPVIIVALRAMGWYFCTGELLSARPYFEQIAALYNPVEHRSLTFHYGQDPGQAGLSAGAALLWLLGYPEQARQWGHRAVLLAQEASHSHSIAFSLVFLSCIHQFCQEPRVTQERVEEAIAICTKQGFALWLSWGMIIRGWVLVESGQGEAGIAQVAQGLAAARATGAEFFRTYFLALLAHAHHMMGQPEAGLTVLAEALAQVEKTQERYWEAELYRLKGELLLMQDRGMENKPIALFAEVEPCFHQAIEIARRQQAKSLELRATTSLCRLWQAQGRRAEAHALLAGIYGWFTEGFDTLDLIEARTLLESLVDRTGG